MSKIRQEVRTFMIYELCRCGGVFKFTGQALTSIPMQYVHECDKCGDYNNFPCTYPYVTHEDHGNAEHVNEDPGIRPAGSEGSILQC
jgi:hypothetical protein